MSTTISCRYLNFWGCKHPRFSHSLPQLPCRCLNFWGYKHLSDKHCHKDKTLIIIITAINHIIVILGYSLPKYRV